MDILKRSKHSTPRPVFCPNCYSPNVKLRESYGILPQMYSCNDCGYDGSLIVELEPENEDHRI